VLTPTEAAAYLRLPEAEVVGVVRAQGLPGRYIAGEWRFLKAAIQHWLATASPTWEMRKAAVLELARGCKDDLDLGSIVEEAYRRRGRPITDGGSRMNLRDWGPGEPRCSPSIPYALPAFAGRSPADRPGAVPEGPGVPRADGKRRGVAPSLRRDGGEDLELGGGLFLEVGLDLEDRVDWPGLLGRLVRLWN
jgi:hypothetical protein